MSDSRRNFWTLVLCCTAQFMVVLDVSIVNVALPSIRGDLHFSGTNLQWVVSAYTLAFAGFLLLGGRAADILGRRRIFISGLLLFVVASLAGGLASGQEMLIAARGAQGLGGAIVAPATLSILTATFAKGPERNKALGAWGAMGGAGGAAGALLGGLLTETLGWRWILFINIPIGLVAAFSALRLVRESRPEAGRRKHFDFLGALTVTSGLVVLVYGIVRTDVNGWGSSTTLGTLALGLALLGVFLTIEGRFASAPLMPLTTFRSRAVSGANVVIFLLGCAAFAMWYFASLYMQEVLDFTPIATGLAFLPMTLMIIIGSTFAGRLVARLGAGPILTLGMSLVAAGLLLFARVAVEGTYGGDVLLPSLLASLGIGLTFVPVTIAAVSGTGEADAGLASGLVNTSRQIGGSVGLAALATLATERTASLAKHASLHEALTRGFHRAFLVGAGFALLGAIAGFAMLARVGAPTPGGRPAEAT